jgi:hypothetical protein
MWGRVLNQYHNHKTQHTSLYSLQIRHVSKTNNKIYTKHWNPKDIQYNKIKPIGGGGDGRRRGVRPPSFWNSVEKIKFEKKQFETIRGIIDAALRTRRKSASPRFLARGCWFVRGIPSFKETRHSKERAFFPCVSKKEKRITRPPVCLSVRVSI